MHSLPIVFSQYLLENVSKSSAATATSQDDLRNVAEKIAKAMQAVGIEQWPRLAANAAERARDPATQAAIKKSRQPPDPARDAIRPVYPIETLLLGMGARGAARTVEEAFLRKRKILLAIVT